MEGCKIKCKKNIKYIYIHAFEVCIYIYLHIYINPLKTFQKQLCRMSNTCWLVDVTAVICYALIAVLLICNLVDFMPIISMSRHMYYIFHIQVLRI